MSGGGYAQGEFGKRERERSLAVLLCIQFSFTDPQRTFCGLMFAQFHRKHLVLERGRHPDSILDALGIIIY